MSENFIDEKLMRFIGETAVVRFIENSRLLRIVSKGIVTIISLFAIVLGIDEKYESEYEIKNDLQEYVEWMEGHYLEGWGSLHHAPHPRNKDVRLLHLHLNYRWVEGITTRHESWSEYVMATGPWVNMSVKSGLKSNYPRKPTEKEKDELKWSEANAWINRWDRNPSYKKYHKGRVEFYNKLDAMAKKYNVRLDRDKWRYFLLINIW